MLTRQKLVLDFEDLPRLTGPFEKPVNTSKTYVVSSEREGGVDEKTREDPIKQWSQTGQ